MMEENLVYHVGQFSNTSNLRETSKEEALLKALDAFLQEEVVDDFYSSAIKGKTTAKKMVRLSTFPDYLLV